MQSILFPSTVLPSASAVSKTVPVTDIGRSPRRSTVVNRLGTAFKAHLSFSLEQVYTSDRPQPIDIDGQVWCPDIWVATLATNPVRSRVIVEPGLIVQVFSAANLPDRARLLKAYRGAVGVREILAIDIPTRSVEVYWRGGGDAPGWSVADYAEYFEIELKTIQFKLTSKSLWSYGELG